MVVVIATLEQTTGSFACLSARSHVRYSYMRVRAISVLTYLCGYVPMYLCTYVLMCLGTCALEYVSTAAIIYWRSGVSIVWPSSSGLTINWQLSREFSRRSAATPSSISNSMSSGSS